MFSHLEALESELDFRRNEVHSACVGEGVGVDDCLEFAVIRKPAVVDVAPNGGFVSRQRIELPYDLRITIIRQPLRLGSGFTRLLSAVGQRR